MKNYEKQLEEEIHDLQIKLEQAQIERDTFQELLDNVIKETYRRFGGVSGDYDSETYSANTLKIPNTEAISKKYATESIGIDIDKEYDRIFKERTETTKKGE